MAVDTDVNAAGRACFVGSNNYEVGLEMGRAMASYLPEGGKVAVIQHMLTTTTGIDRTRGVIDALTKAGNIEILGSFCCDNSTDRAQSLTKELLEQTPDISGFVCTNEVCNVGAANALVELGMGGKVFVVGCDNSQRQIAFSRTEHHSGDRDAAAVQYGLYSCAAGGRGRIRREDCGLRRGAMRPHHARKYVHAGESEAPVPADEIVSGVIKIRRTQKIRVLRIFCVVLSF